MRLEPKNNQINAILEELFISEFGKIVSYLTAKFGLDFIDKAEDFAQEALLTASDKWSKSGIPKNPKGWLYLTAKNKSINYLQREKKIKFSNEIRETYKESKILDELQLDEQIEDSMLKMIFVCCSKIITPENQIVLILNILCGLSFKEISIALILEEETIKKRLYRSKKKLREGNLRLTIPKKNELIQHLDIVCKSLYLLFNEGYNSSRTNNLIRYDICIEAMRLVKLLCNHFPESIKVNALYSLFCFHTARFESRIDDEGSIILFKDQNRELWDAKLINTGVVYLSKASKGDTVTTYHLEAGIAMHHCIAKEYSDTNWEYILKLYEALYQLKGNSPIVKLNMAIVKGLAIGPETAVSELEALKNEEKLKNYYLLYASLGEFYFLLDNTFLSAHYFNKAYVLTDNPTEIKLIQSKIDKLKA